MCVCVLFLKVYPYDKKGDCKLSILRSITDHKISSRACFSWYLNCIYSVTEPQVTRTPESKKPQIKGEYSIAHFPAVRSDMMQTGFYLSTMDGSFSSFSHLFIVCGACRSQLCPSIIGNKLRSSGTVVRHLYPLSHLARPGYRSLPSVHVKALWLMSIWWALCFGFFSPQQTRKAAQELNFVKNPHSFSLLVAKGNLWLKRPQSVSPYSPGWAGSLAQAAHFCRMFLCCGGHVSLLHPVIERPCIPEVLPSSGSERGIPCLLEYAELFISFGDTGFSLSCVTTADLMVRIRKKCNFSNFCEGWEAFRLRDKHRHGPPSASNHGERFKTRLVPV